MTTRIIYLEGTQAARFENVTYIAKGNAHSPVPPLVRRLIAEQRVAPNDLVEVRRDAKVSFKPCPAVRWAAIDIVDDRTKGLHTVTAYLGSHVPKKVPFHGGRVAVQGQPALPG